MNRSLFLGAVLLFGLSIYLTAGAGRAAAQGPAGAGAATAAQEGPHSLNPMKWIKKDSKDASDESRNRSDVEKKLTPKLRSQGLLPASATVTNTCAPFTVLAGCLAALHASHNLGIDFVCLRADVTGVLTSSDVSGCKLSDRDKAQGLSQAIHHLKPDANAKRVAKDAEQQAKDDLTAIGG